MKDGCQCVCVGVGTGFSVDRISLMGNKPVGDMDRLAKGPISTMQ